jgi:hypothetical protein
MIFESCVYIIVFTHIIFILLVVIFNTDKLVFWAILSANHQFIGIKAFSITLQINQMIE